MAEFVLAVAHVLALRRRSRSTFSWCSPAGAACVRGAEELQRVPLHVATHSWRLLPLLLDVTPSRGFGHWPQETAQLAGEGHEALHSTRMLLGSGGAVLERDCEHDSGCGAPEMYRSELRVRRTQMPLVTLG